jgi:PTH1 family peptidyl-tRNA hydrolase
MNNSGEAVAAAADFYKIPPEHILVIFDDISLPPGKIRIRRKGSAGGHNGIRSVIAMIGSEDFPRIKIGVGAKPHKNYDLADWVLGKFPETDMEQMQAAFALTAKSAEEIVAGNIEAAMAKYSH